MSEPIFEIWVIQHRPKEFPQHYVARKWLAGGKPWRTTRTNEFTVSSDLEALRQPLLKDWVRKEVEIGNDPSVIEIWM